MTARPAILIDRQDVRHMADSELADLGIAITDRTNLTLRCNTCGEIWEPPLDSSGKLPLDYWVCPLKCNAAAPK